jgi:acetyltransferase-like isoleucine patch superfamily enzyme
MARDLNHHGARGNFWNRLRATLFILPAWFAPHKSLRAFFHRLRGVNVGKNVEIGYCCLIGNVHPKRIHIEDNVVIAQFSVIVAHDNAYYYTHGQQVVGDIHIREGAFIGTHSVILAGVEIGKSSIIGALSLVKSNIPPFCVAVGQPAKVVSSHEYGRDNIAQCSIRSASSEGRSSTYL